MAGASLVEEDNVNRRDETCFILLFIWGGVLFACLPLARRLFLFVGCGGGLSASCLCLASESA